MLEREINGIKEITEAIISIMLIPIVVMLDVKGIIECPKILTLSIISISGFCFGYLLLLGFVKRSIFIVDEISEDW